MVRGPYIALSRCQFHQHFSHEFFIRTSFLCLEFGFKRTFVCNICTKNVGKIDSRLGVLLLPSSCDTVDQEVDRGVDHEEEVRDGDGAQDPGWRKPANASALAVDDGVDDGEVVDVEDDAEEVAADEDDDDAEEDWRQVEIGVEVTLIQFYRQCLRDEPLKS